jgi:hypothetical protein
VLVLGGIGTGAAAWASWSDAQRDIEEAREVSAVEQSIVDDAVAQVGEIAARIQTQSSAYHEAAALWSESEAAVAQWRAETVAPTPAVPNPGGEVLPGGNEAARALLDSIGASGVQLVFEAGEQNCGYHPAPAGSLALGGCYNSRFRTSLFLAWDAGVGRDAIWPAFVHEAMHWYQWEHYYTMFQAADRLGIGQDAYLPQLEADASCRAVVVHGVPRTAYAASSAPCDVDDWHENWFVEELAALGVPQAAPEVERYEVQAVTRP